MEEVVTEASADLYIYILECEQGKVYVGRTRNPEFRIEDHFAGTGSAWTTKYNPIRVLGVGKTTSMYEENKITLECMEMYGIDNVRGGIYVQVELSDEDLRSIERQMRGAQDRCMKCGESGHFVIDCPQANQVQQEPQVLRHEQRLLMMRQRLPQQMPINKGRFCVKCGRMSHNVQACYSRSDINGRSLGSVACYKCGRDSHYATECYASSDKWGNQI